MTDGECVAFLQWALPRLGRRWAGYRKVRGIVRKRLGRRLRELGLADLAAYRRRLEADPAEWAALDALLGIPISRFWRDREVFAALESEVLPALAHAARAQSRGSIDCWSAGCAGGEEPYTLALLWGLRLQPAFPELALRIVATDCDPALLDRARAGCYQASSLKELPGELRVQGFRQEARGLCVRPPFREAVKFAQQDLRAAMPDGDFDLVCCRNALLTYYAADLQRALAQRIVQRMRPGGALLVGLHETLPEGMAGLAPWPAARATWRRDRA